ncbi:MAG: ferric iron uptake transcriptional regulator [Wolinella sp.]
MKHRKENLDSIYDRLRLSIRKNGLKNSKQREFILKILYENGGHLSPEDILMHAKDNCRGASISSIYRILGFLEKEGFVHSIEVDKSGKKYEIASGIHHDHIICVDCGKIIEFYNKEMEDLQEKIAQDHGVKIISHDMRIFAICNDCAKESQIQ